MKKKTIILLWLVTAYSCSNYSSRLKAVLDYSGTNRAELEKVLDHYSQDPADSLKLKASIFLIENMPGHYTFGGPYMKSYNEQLGLLKNCPYYEKKIIQMVPFDHIGYRQQLDIQEDVKYIKADFLIHQIELAFNQWQTRPWNEGVDFENFKEYTTAPPARSRCTRSIIWKALCARSTSTATSRTGPSAPFTASWPSCPPCFMRMVFCR